jgi:outer membrane protein OmpA-like peptidoglycan-associated protein
MKKLLYIGIGLILLAKISLAQEQFSVMRQADKAYDRYEYFKSLNLYLEVVNKDKPDVKVAERIADCYLHINQYANAEIWYAKAVADSKAGKVSHYFYAEVLLRDQKFGQAKEQYKLYYDKEPESLAFKLANCDSAALWMTQASDYKIENKKLFNTPYSDWGLNYEGKTGLIFTSDRPAGDAVDNRTGNSWFKLYRAVKKTNTVTPVMISSGMSDNFNGQYHIGPIALTPSADTAYVTITTEISRSKLTTDQKNFNSNQKLVSRRLQLVIAVKKYDQWIITGSFPYNNIREYSVSSAALSNNGKLIYFASDMPGGEGMTDIWYCEKQADGKWGKPINCGKTINTPQEDDFPYIDSLGTLYYASKGLPGMGGYDIYSAKGGKADWSEPRNLKYPVNSTSDDFYYVSRNGMNGFFSSNRDGGAGSDDIYAFTHPPFVMAKQPVAIAPRPDSITSAAPGNSSQAFVFEPIYYDLDKSNIRPDAAAELDKLVAFLKQYPEIKIRVASYTDSRASGDYNEALSQRRATAVADYLIAKGIDPNRLTVTWHGESNLVNNCLPGVQCTEAQHQLNRRTEFEVIK